MQTNLPAQKSPNMASHSNKIPQISFKLHSYIIILISHMMFLLQIYYFAK